MTPPVEFRSAITVRPVQQMGGDHMVIAAARVSTCGEEALRFAEPAAAEESAGLIRFLMKHRHGTPFEHSSLTLFAYAPIFVWREWHRHRIGFCLAGDTEIWNETFGVNHGRTLRKRRLKDLYDIWANGVHDSKGRVRFLPSVRNQKLRVLNEDTGFFELGGIEDITQSGVRECLLIETEHKKGWSLRCSADHRILTSEGWARAGDLSGGEMIAVSGKKSIYEHRQIPPSLRAGIGVWTSMQRASLIPADADCYVCGKAFHRSNLVLDHVVPVVEDIKLALDVDNLKPACISCHREKTDKEQSLANRCNVAGVRFERLRRKPYFVSEEMTYDISMKPPWHNFVANGIVVHNSYNEESGRYKQLAPVFYLPADDRPMFKVDGWKPGRPKFTPIGTAEERRRYEALCSRLASSYRVAYDAYLENLADGFDPGLARACLPVGIYSACWVTCNPRSLMAFLGLRTHEPAAAFPSYPLHEIEVAARAAEQALAAGWPITYAAFCENGRVAP
jgi:thymidylate synthase ThyX